MAAHYVESSSFSVAADFDPLLPLTRLRGLRANHCRTRTHQEAHCFRARVFFIRRWTSNCEYKYEDGRWMNTSCIRIRITIVHSMSVVVVGARVRHSVRLWHCVWDRLNERHENRQPYTARPMFNLNMYLIGVVGVLMFSCFFPIWFFTISLTYLARRRYERAPSLSHHLCSLGPSTRKE